MVGVVGGCWDCKDKEWGFASQRNLSKINLKIIQNTALFYCYPLFEQYDSIDFFQISTRSVSHKS
jgi:hypothetical protein